MHSVRKFVEENRQTGSTTQTLMLAAATGGWYVVHSEYMRKHVLKMNKFLKPEQVVTLREISDERFMLGKKPRPIFFDTATVCVLASEIERKNVSQDR